MKGLYPVDELALLPSDFELVGAKKVDVPGNTGERHIIEILASE